MLLVVSNVSVEQRVIYNRKIKNKNIIRIIIILCPQTVKNMNLYGTDSLVTLKILFNGLVVVHDDVFIYIIGRYASTMKHESCCKSNIPECTRHDFVLSNRVIQREKHNNNKKLLYHSFITRLLSVYTIIEKILCLRDFFSTHSAFEFSQTLTMDIVKRMCVNTPVVVL